MSLAAFNRRSPAGAGAAGAHPRPALRRQDLARLLRGAVLGRRRPTPRGDPGAHDRRPDRLRQGHAGERGRRRARLPPARLRRGLPGGGDRRARRRRRRRRRGRRWRRWRGAGPALRRRPQPASAARDVTDSLRREEVGALASRISAWPAVRARACSSVQLAFRDAARPGRRRARHGHASSSPTPSSRCSSPRAPPNVPSGGYKQLISKGISANIDSLRADLEARDARDSNRSVIAPEAGRRRVPAGQLGADDRSFGRLRCSKPGRSAGLSTDRQV